MTNIIFIAYQFPPLNEGGVFRSLYFVKYLNQFNINPVVLTLHPNSFEKVYHDFISDPLLQKEIPDGTDVRYVPSENILNLTNSPLKAFINIFFNIYSGSEATKWKTNLLSEIDKIFTQYDPKALFVTAPPFSMLKLAYEISVKYKLPLILDFRDPWLMWRIVPYGTYFHYLLTKRKQEQYIKHSDAVIATSDQTLIDFMTVHPKVEQRKYKLIYNGYDEVITDWTMKLPPADKAEIVIGYVGSFYYNPEARAQMMMPWYQKKINRYLQYTLRKEDWLYRSPYFFFAAINKLFELDPKLKTRVKIEFIGVIPFWLEPMINQFRLAGNCKLSGPKTKRESIAFQKNCDFLLLTSSKVIDGEDYSIAGKTFEYFSMRKPIIAFVCKGAQKRMLLNSGMSLFCDPDNTSESAKQLLKLFEGKAEITPNPGFLNSLHRKNLTQKLSVIIHNVVANTKNMQGPKLIDQ